MANDDARFTFLPWVRAGAAAAIVAPADAFDHSLPQRAKITVTLTIDDALVRPSSPTDLKKDILLFGPCDVTGIDPREVIRTEPRALTSDFEPNYFPAIEFYRPDFPWLFTPAKAADVLRSGGAILQPGGRLRPWICLVVVPKDKIIELRTPTDEKRPLPVVKVPQNELPDLAESWAWAHAQLVGSVDDGDSMAASDRDYPELTSSRLLCPRRLAANQSYQAFVVPTFDAGRRTGVGEPVATADPLKAAWDHRLPEPIDLPFYYSWEFSTGPEGDFEALTRRLVVSTLADEASYCKVYVGDAAPQLAQTQVGGRPLAEIEPADRCVVRFEGALGALTSGESALATRWLDEDVRPAWQSTLVRILSAPANVEVNDDWSALDVGPPIYGRWYANSADVDEPVPPEAGALPWLRELNLEPCYRHAAALGTAIVQAQQEQLRASAWQQLNVLRQWNAVSRRAQTQREVLRTIHQRTLAPLPAWSLLQLVSPLHTRTLLNQETVFATVSDSALPNAVVSPAFRRATRPRGRLIRRLNPPPVEWMPARHPPSGLLPGLNSGLLSGAPVPQLPWGGVALDETPYGRARTDALLGAPPMPGFALVPDPLFGDPPSPGPVPPGPGPDNSDAKLFREMVGGLADRMERSLAPDPGSAPNPLEFTELGARLLECIDPEHTMTRHFLARRALAPDEEGGVRGVEARQRQVYRPDQVLGGDPLGETLISPKFPQAMYRELPKEWLFPGIADLPANAVAALETNPRFIEAFMIGLNHEMARELIFHGFPTELSCTFFQRFWDRRTAAGEPALDIDELHLWQQGGGLGKHPDADLVRELVVLLIRGDLLRRYPNTVIYLVRSPGWQLGLGPVDGLAGVPIVPEERPAPGDPGRADPLFRAVIEPDITLLGFGLSPADVLGMDPDCNTTGPGWFFAIEEPPTEPRFGLDFSRSAGELPEWSQLSWSDMAPATEQRYIQLSATALDGMATVKTLNPPWGIAASGGLASAAEVADVTLQRPFRMLVQAAAFVDCVPQE